MIIFTAEHYADPTAGLAMARVSSSLRFPEHRPPWPMVYICSPLSGDMPGNQRRARRYSRFALEQGCMPMAPHLLFPQFMNDRDPDERKLAMSFCRRLLGRCRQVWVFGPAVSAGMEEELRCARSRGIPVRWFNEECEEV